MSAARLSLATMTLVLFTTVGGAPRAQAREALSPEVAAQLSLSYVPACTLCHSAGAQGGPADTPFGTSMRARGLGASTDSVAPALDSMRRDSVDSDGDGTTDIDEIVAATDPNGRGDGCDCAAARTADAPSLFACALMLLSLATRRRAAHSLRAHAN